MKLAIKLPAKISKWTWMCASILLVARGGGDSSGEPPAPILSVAKVEGLDTGASVVLLDGGGGSTTVTANGTFTFSTALMNAASYSVTIGSNSTGEAYIVSGGTGTVASSNVTSVAVECNATHTIGGVVSGLNAGMQVVLLDNGGDALTITDNGPLNFATPVTSIYAVSAGSARRVRRAQSLKAREPRSPATSGNPAAEQRSLPRRRSGRLRRDRCRFPRFPNRSRSTDHTA